MVIAINPLQPQDSFESAGQGLSDGAWDFQGQDTRCSTHAIHTYVAAMIPGLARKLIDTYVPTGGSVLDPFCGGGAVLVEAIRSGREAVGRDINNLAVLVSKAKTTYIDGDSISRIGARVLAQAKNYNGLPMRFGKLEYVEFWFKDYMLLPLTALKISIDAIDSPDLRTLFRVLFSTTVRNVSLTYRNEVRLRRMSTVEQEKFNPDVFAEFTDQVRLAAQRVPQLPMTARADVEKEDSRHLRFSNEAVDAIICSPPYGDERNGVNYTQFAKNMLYWLGYGRQDLKDSKALSLGWGKAERVVPPSATLFNTLEAMQDNPVAVREAIAFYADYYETLRQLARVVRQRVIIVIGNRVLHRTILNNAQITAELMDSIGVPLEVAHFRRLPSKRLPKMREFGAAIDQEAILVFKK
ncbi:MAG: DNA adenine methylase [Chloroflexi bacterium]|nr:DNA adenine methylase [Chloroflexota bacterium]